MNEYNQGMTDHELLDYSEADFIQLVSKAFQDYHRLLTLAHLSLAHASLVIPALILDELAPTSDERGRALRVVLRWAVGRLVPALPRYPLGVWRPYDDPTWGEPLWWGYNILRHRYLEPLPPDDREDGFAEALVALTGIPDADSYYKERNRAVTEVARFLREQLARHPRDAEIRHLALEELSQAMLKYPSVAQLLGLASTLRGEFPRALLLDLAEKEGLSDAMAALGYTLGQRLLQEGDGGSRLWIPPALQAYLHAQQPRAKLLRHHRRVLAHYREYGPTLETTWHLRMSGNYVEAARELLDHAETLIGELQSQDLHTELVTFEACQLPQALWFQVQLVLWDVCRKLGDREGALAACRRALKSAASPGQRAKVYRRFGKLYEDHSQRQALDYYQRAIERFSQDGRTPAELADTLKDRAWIYLHRQEWDKAETDLKLALERAGTDAWKLKADVHNALASLYRQQKDYERALSHAQTALMLREENGGRHLVAESWSNVALVYTHMGKTAAALSAYRESLQTFERLKDVEASAIVQLNMGTALQLAERFTEAIEHYETSLATFEEIDIPLSQSQACYNLAETHAAVDDIPAARRYWLKGYRLGQDRGLDGELTWYKQLAEEIPALEPQAAVPSTAQTESAAPAHDLSPQEKTALDIIACEGSITARRLMTGACIAKPTATRKLKHLTELGLLVRRGKGRGVHYVLA